MPGRERLTPNLKRELRRRCGFGCAMCGCPVFDYEHIDGYGLTGHDPARMTLLCPHHHREKTAGRLSPRQVAEANAAPYNTGEAFTAGHPLFFDPAEGLRLRLGNVTFEAVGNGAPMVGVSVDSDFALGVALTDTGHPVVSMDIRDAADAPRLLVREGFLRIATSNWDVDFVGTRLLLRNALRKVAIDVHLNGPDGLVDVRSANFWLHHVPVRAGRQATGGGFELPAIRAKLHNLKFKGSGVSIGGPARTGSTIMQFASSFNTEG